MSDSIDRRVVEMRFDNKDFEQNVNTTMTVLDKLTEKLSFKGVEKGFNDISDAAKNTDFKGMGGAIDAVQAKFSALEVMAITALSNITNSAVNAGKRLVSAFTIDPIKTGFQEYETQINAVQTILANTSAKGTKLEDVNKALDELNHYADKTIYNFTEMTRNIGTFTAAGIDLDTSVNAIQGIANLAAVSGSNAQQASTAMYQLSQALASGTVKLQDWNSVVNAGMGGEVFQNALKETARLHGVAVDEMIKKNGSFRESLKEGWITSEILTETLKKFTVSGVNEYLAKNTDLSKEQIENMRESADASKDWEKAYHDMAKRMAKNSKLSEDQIFEYLKMSKTAEDAATKVKTFSQLMDTLKEAAQSGWTQTWEILIGDFNEAKGLFTGISDALSKVINASADARNKVLQEWKDLGGRDSVLKSFGNLFKAFTRILAPIKEAFRNIFPPTTAKQLKSITDGFEKFTKSLIISDKTSNKIKKVFTGLFSVLKVGVKVVQIIAKGFSILVKVLLPIGKAGLSILSALGSGLSKVAGLTYQFASAVDKIAGSVDKAVSKLGKLSVNLGGFTSSIGKLVGGLLPKVSGGLSKFFDLLGKIDLAKLGGMLAGGGVFAAGMKMSKFFGSLKSLSGTLNSFTASVRVKPLLTISSAIGVLAMSCYVLSTIPAKKLGASVSAIGGLFIELTAASRLVKGSRTKGLVSLSFSIVLLAKAVKTLSEIENLKKGLVGVGALLGEITGFCLIFDRMKIRPKTLKKTGEGLILMSIAINMLSKPVKELGAMKTKSLVKGLGAIATMMLGFAITAKIFSKIDTKGLAVAGISMLIMAEAMKILVVPLSQLAKMKLKSLGKGLGAMGVALLEIAGFAAIMGRISKSSGSMLKTGAALLVMSIGISIMAKAIKTLGNTKNVGKGLSALFAALLILSGAMALMKKNIAGAAAMIVVAGALAIMAPAIALLSKLSFKGVVTGLAALALTLGLFAGAATLLGPLIPVMLGLAVAVGVLGAGVLALGVGLGALVVALAGGAAMIVESAKIIGLAIVALAQGLAEGLLAFLQTLTDGMSVIQDFLMQLLDTLLVVLSEMTPKIVEVGYKLLINLLKGISDHIGEVVTVAITLIVNFVNAISENLDQVIDAGFNFVLSFLEGMSNAITERGPQVMAAITDLLLSVLQVLVGSIPIVGGYAAKAIDSYRQGLRNKAGLKNTKSAAAEVSKTTTTALKIPDQKQNGINVLKGLTLGLTAKGFVTSLKNAAQKIADIVDKAIKKKNEIKSPSRLMYRNGRYIVQGLINGVDSLTDVYRGKAEGIASTMISAVDDSSGALAASIDNAFSPTLSMSKVRAFAEGIEVTASGTLALRQQEAVAQQMSEATKALNAAIEAQETNHTFNLNVPLSVDGRQFARAQGTYMQDELDRIGVLDNRKLGIL